MPDNLEKAVEHPDMTERLVDVLSISLAEAEYRVETGVGID